MSLSFKEGSLQLEGRHRAKGSRFAGWWFHQTLCAVHQYSSRYSLLNSVVRPSPYRRWVSCFLILHRSTNSRLRHRRLYIYLRQDVKHLERFLRLARRLVRCILDLSYEDPLRVLHPPALEDPRRRRRADPMLAYNIQQGKYEVPVELLFTSAQQRRLCDNTRKVNQRRIRKIAGNC